MEKYINRFEEDIVDNEIEEVCVWLRREVLENKVEGCIVEMSSGIDWLVVARLLGKESIPVLLVDMSCEGSESFSNDMKNIGELAKPFKFNCTRVNIADTVDMLTKTICTTGEVSVDSTMLGIESSVKKVVLSSLAQEKNYLVVGTGNFSELKVGCFEKFSDGLSDLNPLAMFTKSEINVLASRLSISKSVINKKHSKSIGGCQTSELDNYLITGCELDSISVIVEERRKRSNHKMRMINAFDRDLGSLYN